MTTKEYLLYRPNKVLWNNIIPLALCIFVASFNYRTTYFSFFDEPPGSYFVIFMIGIVILRVALRLPEILMSVTKVPFLELSGSILTIRGWAKTEITLTNTTKPFYISNQGKNISIKSGDLTINKNTSLLYGTVTINELISKINQIHQEV